MSLSFFSDQCVPTEIIESLRQRGHQVMRLQEIMPDNSPDPKVIEKCHETGAILRFLDENPLQDFYKGKLFIVEPHRIRIR